MSSRLSDGTHAAAILLRQISKLISSVTQSDLDAITSGQARISLVYDSKAVQKVRIKGQLRESADLDSVRKSLSVAESVEAGRSVLEEFGLSRAELANLARSLEIAVTKSDTVPRLEEKLIEATVGSRLNSRAVRGG